MQQFRPRNRIQQLEIQRIDYSSPWKLVICFVWLFYRNLCFYWFLDILETLTKHFLQFKTIVYYEIFLYDYFINTFLFFKSNFYEFINI